MVGGEPLERGLRLFVCVFVVGLELGGKVCIHTYGRPIVYLVALVLLVELEHEEVDGEEARDEEESVHAG